VRLIERRIVTLSQKEPFKHPLGGTNSVDKQNKKGGCSRDIDEQKTPYYANEE